MKKTLSLAFAIFFAMSTTGVADTIHVPIDQPTIQSGIDAAMNGDLVLVSPGTYVENIDFLGKAITVRSSHGANRTVIDGSSPMDPDKASVVSFVQGEGPDSQLVGFLLTNGTGTLHEQQMYGGGILCNGSSPTITKNIISSNTIYQGSGGGICCYQSDAVIKNNTIEHNTMPRTGGGIFCFDSSAVITENRIEFNGSGLIGGGIHCLNATPIISNNTIAHNTGGSGCGGGGISSDWSAPIIMENIIEYNSIDSFAGGGGIMCFKSSPVIMDNVIRGNTADEGYNRAGGIFSYISTSLILNNRIEDNSALCDLGGGAYTGYGGGIQSMDDEGTVIAHNRIIGNEAGEGGGIVFNGQVTITGNTISDNRSYSDWHNGGGGIRGTFCVGSEITNNKIYNNVSKKFGGGIFVDKCDQILIRNNYIHGNHAVDGGGVGFFNKVGMTLINNTITNNTAIDRGGAVFCTNGSELEITNSILWNNSDSSGMQIVLEGYSDPCSLVISYSDIEGGEGALLVEAPNTYEWGAGIIDVDPMFVDAYGGDLHLTYLSPCLNAGDHTVPSLANEDVEGDPRIAYGFVDMGADEFHPHFYCTGEFTPEGEIQGKFVGLPSTQPVGLFIGSGLLENPIQHMWGAFYLETPLLMVPMPLIPMNGVLIVEDLIPALPSPPYDVHMQSLIGDMLSNPCTLEVR